MKNFEKLIPKLFIFIFLFLISCSEEEEQKFYKGEQILGTEKYISSTQVIYSAYPKVSPDGKKIVYVNLENDFEDTGLWVMDLETLEKTMIFEGYPVSYPSWSPNGEWIVFDCGAICKVKVNGDSLTQLTFDGVSNECSWSPLGGWIAYTHSPLNTQLNQSGVWRMRADGSDKEFLFLATKPSWHPTKNKILGIRQLSSSKGLNFFIYDLNSKSIDTLDVFPNENNLYANFSPDGSKILFQNGKGFFIMVDEGREIKQVFKYESEFFAKLPSWFQDSRHLIYQHFEILERVESESFGSYYSGNLSFYKLDID